jgi:DUF1365 family protein
MELKAVIAEVNNTFDERRMYLLPAVAADSDPDSREASLSDAATSSARRQKFHYAWPKDFHVSPFSSRKGSYALSAVDPFLSEGLCGTHAVDVTATLLSSKGRPKLVARLWSNAEPLDPVTISVFRAIALLVSWWWVGLVTCMSFPPFFLQ